MIIGQWCLCTGWHEFNIENWILTRTHFVRVYTDLNTEITHTHTNKYTHTHRPLNLQLEEKLKCEFPKCSCLPLDYVLDQTSRTHLYTYNNIRMSIFLLLHFILNSNFLQYSNNIEIFLFTKHIKHIIHPTTTTISIQWRFKNQFWYKVVSERKEKSERKKIGRGSVLNTFYIRFTIMRKMCTCIQCLMFLAFFLFKCVQFFLFWRNNLIRNIYGENQIFFIPHFIQNFHTFFLTNRNIVLFLIFFKKKCSLSFTTIFFAVFFFLYCKWFFLALDNCTDNKWLD